MTPIIGDIWHLEGGDDFMIVNIRPFTDEEREKYAQRGNFKFLVIMQDVNTCKIQPYAWPESAKCWTRIYP